MKRTPIETIEKDGFKAEIFPDEDPSSPRENDNIGIMFCSHKNYNLGDEQFKSGDFNGWDEVEQFLIKERKAVVILPLYLYDHSGITISTTPFSCRWDSGQVGFIYATKQKVKKEYGTKADAIENATKYLEGEVKEYDQFLTGDVYSIYVSREDKCDHGTDHREEVDSCCGFYGLEYAKEEAQRMLDYATKEVVNG